VWGVTSPWLGDGGGFGWSFGRSGGGSLFGEFLGPGFGEVGLGFGMMWWCHVYYIVICRPFEFWMGNFFLLVFIEAHRHF
jgi:hypothetical protein